MAKVFSPKIVSANDLMDGDVVYLSTLNTWSRLITEAAIAQDQAAADALLADGEKRQDLIVGAYLLDVAIGSDGTPSPTHFREKYRLNGPSIDYLAPQKQSLVDPASAQHSLSEGA